MAGSSGCEEAQRAKACSSQILRPQKFLSRKIVSRNFCAAWAARKQSPAQRLPAFVGSAVLSCIIFGQAAAPSSDGWRFATIKLFIEIRRWLCFS
ncbi:MAG: hypothetical protein HIU92_07680 [Proteobacteria bacterium]|nr:hypothetical protein [Pseudomonadota bacterium]